MRREEVEKRLQELESYLKAKSLYTEGAKRRIEEIREANDAEDTRELRESLGQLDLLAAFNI